MMIDVVMTPWIFGAIFFSGGLTGMAIGYGCFWFGYHRPMMRAMRGNIAGQLVSDNELRTFLAQAERQGSEP